MQTFQNNRIKLQTVVAALGLCDSAMMALARAVEQARMLLPEAAIPACERFPMQLRIQEFVSTSGARLNQFVSTALEAIDQRYPAQTINHIVQSYELGGPLMVPALNWLVELSDAFTEQWATELFAHAKPQLVVQ